MKKILLGLFFVLSLVSLFSFSATASATGFDDVDWTVPMTSTAQARLRIGVANFAKVWAYKATMTNGEVSALSLVCQYASSTTGVNPSVKECTTFINNDNTNLIMVGFSNTPNAGMMADLLPGSGGAFALSDGVQYPRIVSASVLAPGASPTIAQLIPEVNYGFPSLPQDPIAQNGDDGWNYLPFSNDSAWMGIGLPVPAEPGHYTITLIKNAGASQSSGPSLDFKANGSVVPVTLTALPSVASPVTLTWSPSGVSSCSASTTATPTNASASTVWSGNKAVTGGTFAISSLAASATYVFKLDCSDAGGNHIIKSVTVKTPGATASVAFTPTTSPTVSVEVGQSATLNWTSNNVANCTMSNGGSTPNNLVFPVSPAGLTNVTSGWSTGIFTVASLPGTYLYNISCNAVLGALPAVVTSTAKVEVTAPVPVASVDFASTNFTATAGVITTISWTPINAGSCTVASTSTPAGPAITTTSNSWSGAFPTAGTFEYKVTCQRTGTAMPLAPFDTATIIVAALPPGPSLSFTPPIPTSVTAGGSLTLAWTSSGMATNSCNRTGGFGTWATTGGATNSSATMTAPTTTGDYNFIITCTTIGGQSVSINTNVTVTTGTPAPVATVTFTVPIPTSVQANGNITLNWTSNNNVVANSCDRTGGFGTWAMTNGTANGSSGVLTAPAFSSTGNNSYTFTITCDSVAGASQPTATASVTVEVTAAPLAPVVTLKANGQSSITIPYGTKATLTWTSNTGGPITSCVKGPAGSAWTSNTLNNSNQVPTYTGSLSNPGGTITYTFKCFGPGAPVAGVTAQATVTWAQVVGPLNPSVNIWADPNPVPSGNNTTIHWEAFNSTGCIKTNGSGSNWTAGNQTSGTLTVGAPTTLGTVTYDISCAGNPGTQPAVDSVTVSVGTPIPPPIVTLKANGQSSVTIPYGTKATLTWTSNTGGPITSCVKGPAGSAWTSNTLNNSNQVPAYTGSLNSSQTIIYTFSCTGPGSTTPVTASATVKWAPPIGIKLTATPLTPPLVVGGKVKFNWTTSGATSCNKTFVLAGGVSPTPTNAGLVSSFTTGALPLGIHTFTLSCVNSFTGITANASASVKVNSNGSTPVAPTATLDATLYVVPLNQVSTLTWGSIGSTTSCTRTGGTSTNWTTTIAGPLDAKTGSWNVPTNIAGTKVYSIQCFGTGGASQIVSKQIIVQPYQNPPTVNITANNTANSLSAPKGSIVTIKWNTGYCSSTDKSSSPVVPNWAYSAGGTFNSPTTGAVGSSITYSILCTGWPGSVPATVTGSVTVTLTAPPIPSPTVDVSATHLSLPWGPASDPDYSTTVNWNVTKATSCTKTGNWSGNLTLDGNGNSSGSTFFSNVWTDRTYGINCNGLNGANPYTASDSVTIDVE